MKKIDFIVLILVVSMFIVIDQDVDAGICCCSASECDGSAIDYYDPGSSVPGNKIYDDAGTGARYYFEPSDEEEDGGGGGGYVCSPSCSGNECGDNGCGGSCGSCDGLAFTTGCAGKVCEFQDTSLTVEVEPIPCISESKREFTVRGVNNYCGDLEILIYYPESTESHPISTDTFGSYNYEHTFVIPDDVVLAPEPTIKIEVKGDRMSRRDPKDEGNYDCEETIDSLNLNYKNFYYCPDFSEGVTSSEFDYYDKEEYYNFYDNDKTYNWDEDCVSDESVSFCSPNPTDCVDENGDTFSFKTAHDADSDDEIEVCHAIDNIQGGWLDPDVNADVCSYVSGGDWFDCDPLMGGCDPDKDTFAPEVAGFCCGDENDEKAISTKILKNWDNEYVKNNDGSVKEYTACCDPQDSCVDETGICREENYEYCLAVGGVKGVCTNTGSGYDWVLYNEPTCVSGCEKCDNNQDAKVDDIDLTNIELNYESTGVSYNAVYDVNEDNVVDEADREFCHDNFFEQTCAYCGDNLLQPTYESCDVVDSVIEYACPEDYCSVENNAYYERQDTCDDLICECSYEFKGCDKTECPGTCEVDDDCDSGYLCNLDTCSCLIIGCPMGTSLCDDGTCKPDCNFVGCDGSPDDVCSPGEGCACIDCLGQQSICNDGGVCGPDGLCGCPEGTALCNDGTCSSDCVITDDDFAACLLDDNLVTPFIKNPSFETDEAWNFRDFERITEKSKTGSYSVKSVDYLGAAEQQEINVQPLTKYQLSGYIFNELEKGNAYLDLKDIPEECQAISTKKDQWELVSCEFTTSLNTNSVVIRLVTDHTQEEDPVGVAYFDDIELLPFESVVVKDYSGEGNDGTLYGPTLVDGKYGKAYEFDGVNDYIITPNSAVLEDISEGSYTYEAWYYPKEIPPDIQYNNYHFILCKQGEHNPLLYHRETHFNFHMWNDNHQSFGINSGASNLVNNWYHVVGTFDINSKEVNLYVNGIHQGTEIFTGTPKDHGQNPIKIGMCNGFGQNWAGPAEGIIDEVKIYSRALSPGEITNSYQGIPVSDAGLELYYPFEELEYTLDYSGNGNTGEVNGATLIDGKYGKGYNFNGINNYIEVFNSSTFDLGSLQGLRTDATFSMWVKTDCNECGIMSILAGHEGNRGHDRHIFTNNGKIDGRIWHGDNGGFEIGDKDIGDDSWHLITMTIEEEIGSKFFIDGVEDTTVTKDQSDFNWSDRLWLGFSNDADNNYFNGIMDEFRVYNRVLNQQEISNLYQGNSVLDNGLVLYYPFDESLDNNTQPNSICEYGEGCACSDCEDQQDGCIFGLACDDGLCACVPTQEYETIIDDGIDNDCDGLIDEPYFDDPGVYIWEANCDYYMCVYSHDSNEYTTTGVLSGSGFSQIREHDWENDDSYTYDNVNNLISFTSELKNDLDCLIFKTDSMVTYDLNLSKDNVYLTQRKINPLENPFDFSSPECNSYCEYPNFCGTTLLLIGRVDCDYEQCIFDCGGYWVDVESGYDFLPEGVARNPGDYCSVCSNDMVCSNYTNLYSCHFDPCEASLTYFGCNWDEASDTCEDAFSPCMPGTTLCKDGSCSQDCEDTDTANAGCIGYPDNVCELGEGCACSDCDDDQASCTNGAICGDNERCGCPEDTTLCNDKTCDETCEDNGGKTGCIGSPNNKCEFGEGCACEDCLLLQDSCVEGIVCEIGEEVCSKFGIEEKCPAGTTLCNDGTCDNDCNNNGGKRECYGDPDDICQYGEGCACEDCDEKRDNCVDRVYCNYDTKLCEGEDYPDDDDDDDDDDEEQCIDKDSDNYYKIDKDCIGSNDCNDRDRSVNPRANEICNNNKDDNCDGYIDEDCDSSLKVKLGSIPEVRVLDKFELEITVNNNLNKEIEQVELNVDVPTGIKPNKQTQKIYSIDSKDFEKVTYELFVKDFKQDKADITLNIEIPEEVDISEELSVNIDIPKFLVAADPEDVDEKCVDLYYVINDNSLQNEVDLELNVIDPNALLSKTVVLDYLRSIKTKGIVIEELISNPYCLEQGNDYEIFGYLYQSTPGLIVDTVAQSKEYLKTSNNVIKITVDINDV